MHSTSFSCSTAAAGSSALCAYDLDTASNLAVSICVPIRLRIRSFGA